MGQEQDQNAFVFDYLYVDKARLSYLIAQLDSDGVVATRKRLSSLAGTTAGEVKGNITVIGASTSAQESHSESSELQFDASWLLPSNVLAVLEQHALIKRGLAGADVGQIVLLSGSVNIFDIDLVKRLWDGMTAFMAFESTGSVSPKAAQAERKRMELAGKVVKDLPPALQFTITTDDGAAWAQLHAPSMTIDPHAVTLKHGPKVQGTWHVVAILDAVPDSMTEGTEDSPAQFINMMIPLMSGLREIIGRPSTSFGITPLLVFRECH